MEAKFVIVGGGIAGVSCAETLAFLEPDHKIVLVSESSLIKTATNLRAVTRTLSHFDVEEKHSDSLSEAHANLTVVNDKITQVDDKNNLVRTKSGKRIRYDFLCLCSGAIPKLIPISVEKQAGYVLGIRDTDSVSKLISKLENSRKLVVVGNGGIASELVHKVRNTELHWVVKDEHISATFVDPGAGEFFQTALQNRCSEEKPIVIKRMRYNEVDGDNAGAALGPDWYKDLDICGSNDNGAVSGRRVQVHYKSEVVQVNDCQQNLDSEGYPIEVRLSTGEKIACDLVVSATGVLPQVNFELSSAVKLSEDGGILVNHLLQSSVPNIHAAGDICTPDWELALHWFPMKLWTQARQTGCYAAKSMAAACDREEIFQDFCFEMFAHSTRLFGYKVVLLGLYNGQKLGQNYEILLRMTKGEEYIKFVLKNGRLQGAILIGETGLEETCENLILNQIDLTPYGDDILNPDIDIEDYFD